MRTLLMFSYMCLLAVGYASPSPPKPSQYGAPLADAKTQTSHPR